MFCVKEAICLICIVFNEQRETWKGLQTSEAAGPLYALDALIHPEMP